MYKKMLIVVTALCLLCSVWCQNDKIEILAPSKVVLELRKYAEACGKDFGVDPNELRKMITGTLPNDKAHKEFMYCMCHAPGFLEEDGHYNVDKMLIMTPTKGTREDYKSNIENCNKITKENYLDTAFEMYECFHRYYIPKVETTKRS